jgi:hypothetical protein
MLCGTMEAIVGVAEFEVTVTGTEAETVPPAPLQLRV